jgi:hypothetical protein
MEIIETTTLQQQSMSSKFKRICVFCGSSQGKKTSYQVAATDLGNELVPFFFFFNISICLCLPIALHVLFFAKTRNKRAFGYGFINIVKAFLCL